MIRVELYSEANELQRHDAEVLLKEFSNKIKWNRHGDRTIDIGSGDGGVLMEIIKKYIPDNYKVIVGSDKDEESVCYANKRYSDEKIKFITLNIEENIPKTLLSSFDHVFSFYVIHWVKDQRRAFKNMYDLMDEGGDMLVMLNGYMTLFEFCHEVCKIEKWKKYIGDVTLSPYHDSQSPEYDIKQIMSQVGFKNIEIKCQMKYYKFKDFEFLKKNFLAMNPFIVPEELYDEFIETLTDIYIKLRNKNENNAECENEPKHDVKYNLIIVYGTK